MPTVPKWQLARNSIGVISPSANMCSAPGISKLLTKRGADDLPEQWQALNILCDMVGQAMCRQTVEHGIDKGLQALGIRILAPVGIQLTLDQMLHCAKQVLDGPVQVMAVGRQIELETIGMKADSLMGVVGVLHLMQVGCGLDGVVVEGQPVGFTVCSGIPSLDDVEHVVQELLLGGLLCLLPPMDCLQGTTREARHGKDTSLEGQAGAANRRGGL